jgi:5-methylcytosine-specific restriction endonuclease McrA
MNAMKFDFFRRKKFKCNVCGDKFKTDTELEHIAEESTLGNIDGLSVS